MLLKRKVKNYPVGAGLFINAILMDEPQVELLRYYIKKGILTPDRRDVERIYKDVDAVMSGEVILPQTFYTKTKEVET